MNVRVEPTGRIVHETSLSGVTKCGIMHAMPNVRTSCALSFALTGASETQDEVDCMACIVGLTNDSIRFNATVKLPVITHYVEFTFEIESKETK